MQRQKAQPSIMCHMQRQCKVKGWGKRYQQVDAVQAQANKSVTDLSQHNVLLHLNDRHILNCRCWRKRPKMRQCQASAGLSARRAAQIALQTDQPTWG